MTDMSPEPEFGSSRAIGSELRHAREAQGLELSDVADRTRVPLRHLTAIESGAYDGLPAATYSVGFVKSYARVLGLDGSVLSKRFREEMSRRQAPEQRYEPYEPADPARTPGRWLAWSMAGIAAILLLGYLYWRGSQTAENPAAIATQTQTTPAPTAAPAQPAAPAPAPAATTTNVVLIAEQPAWLRITDGEAKLYQGVLNPGERFEIPATAADPRLRTSRVTAIKVTVGNVTIPPLGPPETLVKNVSLTPQALLDRAKGAAAPAPQP